MGIRRFGQVCRAGYFCMQWDSAVLFSIYLWEVCCFAARGLLFSGQGILKMDRRSVDCLLCYLSMLRSLVATVGLGGRVPYTYRHPSYFRHGIGMGCIHGPKHHGSRYRRKGVQVWPGQGIVPPPLHSIHLFHTHYTPFLPPPVSYIYLDSPPTSLSHIHIGESLRLMYRVQC